MNFEFFISKRISSSQHLKSNKNKVNTFIRIATVSIAISVLSMVLSVCIVKGFQAEIRNKVIDFDAHLRIGKFDVDQNLNSAPILKNQPFIQDIKKDPDVKHVQVFAEKGGIVKTKKEVQGVLFKGIGDDFMWDHFKDKIIEGTSFGTKDSLDYNKILIGEKLAQKLQLKVGSKMKVFFIQEPIRARVFTVSGIFKSGFVQFDESYCLVNIKHIQKLNDWTEEQVAGYEVFINKYEDLDKLDALVYNYIGYDLNTMKVNDKYPEIFGWLNLLDKNVQVVLILSIIVAILNMLSMILIILLDKTRTIGILKVLGTSSFSVVKIFFLISSKVILKGIFWGNLIALALCFLQDQFKIITLPSESYYIDYVPISFEWEMIVLISLLTLVSSFIAFIGPALVIARIKPAATVKFN